MANIKPMAPNTKKFFSFTAIASVVVLVLLIVLFVVSSLGTTSTYDREVFFSDRMDYSYDITKVQLSKEGATLYNKGDKSDIVQINPLKLSSIDGQENRIIEFKEDADIEGDASIKYQFSADEKTWTYFNGERWATVGACETCYNTAEEVNSNINLLKIPSKHLRVKVMMRSDDSNTPVLRSLIYILKGKDDGKAVSSVPGYAAEAFDIESSIPTPASSGVSCPQAVVDEVIASGSDKKNVYAWDFAFEDEWSGSGTSLENTTNIHDMAVHISCSAEYTDGYPDKGEPIESQGDPAVTYYSIVKYTVELDNNNNPIKCDISKTCGETFGPYCGDGITNGSEQCDDGNDDDVDECDNQCHLTGPVCGNGDVEEGEECDDGNTQNGDGCSSSCQNELIPPVAVNDNRETPYETPIGIDVLVNDYDTDGVLVPNTILIVGNPSFGTITNVNTTNGDIEYTPNNGFVGVDTFNYKICDNDGLCDTAIVTIVVKPRPLVPPVAIDDSDVTEESTPVTVDVLNNDFDIDGVLVPSTVEVTSNPSNGSITNVNLTTGEIEYTPNAGFFGVDTYNYKVCDNDGLCDEAKVTITITENPKFPPVAVNDTDTTDVGVPVTTNILTNDSDPDGVIVPSTVTVISNPSFGTITNINPSNGFVQYTPNPGYVGIDTYVYEVCDNDGLCDTATVTITINQIVIEPLPPVAVDDFETTQINTPVDVNLLNNDFDPDGVLVPSTTVIIVPPTNGTVTNIDAGTGVATYLPNTGFVGTDTFVYQVCDNDGLCDTAVAVIQIESAELIPPVAIDDSRTTLVGTPIDIDVLENDFDLDGVLIPSTTLVTTDPTDGTIVSVDPNTGVMTYQPNAGFVGVDTYTYEVCDDDGLCDTALVTITISTEVLIPPVAVDDATETPVDTPVTIDLPINDSDEDGTIVTTCMSVVSQPTNGTVTINTATGLATYTPNTGFIGLDTFVYEICDNDNLFDTATVTVNVLPSDNPLIIPQLVLPDPTPIVIAPEIIGVDPAFCGVSYASGTNNFTGTLAGDYDANTILEYSLSNGLSWRPLSGVDGLGTGAATFSFTLDDYLSGDYNLIVRAIPAAGDVVGTIDCPFSVDLGDLIFGANEFVLTEQQGPMVANGLIQFRKDEPQRLWIEAMGASVFNIQDLDNIDRVFPLTYDEDVKLWTGELVFDETGLFRLEGQISNSVGGAYSREINSVFVTEGRDILDYKTEELVDASVTIYEKDTFTGEFVIWNGSAYGQANPYITNGQLSMILPQGEFYIEISHPDYNTITSLITVIDDQSLVRAEVRMLKTGLIDRLTSLVDASSVTNNFPLEITPLPDFGLLEVGEVVPDIIGEGKDTGTYSLLDVLDQDKYSVLMVYSDWNTESQEQIEIYSDLVNNYVDVMGDVQFAEISTMPPGEVELTYLERGEYTDVTYFEPNDQFYDDYMIISLPHFMVLNPDKEFLGQVVGSYPASELADRLADIVATDQ